jgi:hypothetical protein
MKHSSTWFALILIASASLLSRARSATAQSPNQPTRESESATAQNQANGNPAATPVDQRHSEKTSDGLAKYSYTYKYYSAPAQSPPVWFQELSTIVLLIFTFGLVFVGYKQAQWMSKQSEWMGKTNTIYEAQKELLRQQTILAHRPRIRVRDFNLLQELKIDGPIEISCDIANVGGTQATFVASNITIKMGGSDSVPWKLFTRLPHPYDGDLHYVEDWIKKNFTDEPAPTLDSGITLAITKTRHLHVQPDELENFKSGRFAVYVLGYFFYRDGANQHHRTAFCRKMLFRDLRFQPVDDRDLEYED